MKDWFTNGEKDPSCTLLPASPRNLFALLTPRKDSLFDKGFVPTLPLKLSSYKSIFSAVIMYVINISSILNQIHMVWPWLFPQILETGSNRRSSACAMSNAAVSPGRSRQTRYAGTQKEWWVCEYHRIKYRLVDRLMVVAIGTVKCSSPLAYLFEDSTSSHRKNVYYIFDTPDTIRYVTQYRSRWSGLSLKSCFFCSGFCIIVDTFYLISRQKA